MPTFNRISNAIFDVLLAPFGHERAAFDLFLWPTLMGVLAILIYKAVSNQEALARVKSQISMRVLEIRILLAANYFDEQKIRTVADRVGAEAVIVPLLVGGKLGVEDYFQLVDCWVDGLLAAAERKGLLETGSVHGRPE